MSVISTEDSHITRFVCVFILSSQTFAVLLLLLSS